MRQKDHKKEGNRKKAYLNLEKVELYNEWTTPNQTIFREQQLTEMCDDFTRWLNCSN